MSAHQPDSGPKVLRVGLVREGRIIEERTLAPGAPLRVGVSEKNDLVIRGADLGASSILVDARRGKYVLRVPIGLRGRVGRGGEATEITGDEGEIVLDEACRGRLQIGDATILFQFVPAPVKAQRAQLPAGARGGLAAGIDWLFTSFVVASYMGFFGLVIYLENADWELAPTNLLPEVTARLIFNEPEPPPERMDQTPLIDEVAPDDEAEPTPEHHAEHTPSERSRPSAEQRASAAERNARIREQAMASARQLVIGGIGESGLFDDALMDGAPTQNAEEVLRLVSVVNFAARDDEFRERPGGSDGSGTRGHIGRVVRRETQGEVETGMVRERTPRGITTLRPPIDDDGTGDLDMRVVASTVRRRIAGIRRCYERELPGNPTLAGKVTVEFVVQESGSITGSRSVENLTGSPTLGRCLSSLVGRLRINPGPRGGSVTVRYPFIFALQQ